MKKKSILTLVAWYIPTLIVQYFAATVTMDNLEPWYTNLTKAAWNPPPWVFGPVWTLLYVMMAIAVWTVYSTEGSKKEKMLAYALYFAQLLLNAFWSVLFFGWGLYGWSALEIFLLIATVLWMTIHYYRINKNAGLLLLPYLAWIIYASTLNVAIWVLN